MTDKNRVVLRVALIGLTDATKAFIDTVAVTRKENPDAEAIRFTHVYSESALRGGVKLSDAIENPPISNYQTLANALENTPGNPDGSLFGGCNPMIQNIPTVEEFEHHVRGEVHTPKDNYEVFEEAKIDLVIFDLLSTNIADHEQYDALLMKCIEMGVPFFINELPDNCGNGLTEALEDADLPYVGVGARPKSSCVVDIVEDFIDAELNWSPGTNLSMSQRHIQFVFEGFFKSIPVDKRTGAISIDITQHIGEIGESFLNIVTYLHLANSMNLSGYIKPIAELYTSYPNIKARRPHNLKISKVAEARNELEMLRSNNLMALGQLYSPVNGKFRRKV